jgi:hypothetical protein
MLKPFEEQRPERQIYIGLMLVQIIVYAININMSDY